jgi:hypothetical protein
MPIEMCSAEVISGVCACECAELLMAQQQTLLVQASPPRDFLEMGLDKPAMADGIPQQVGTYSYLSRGMAVGNEEQEGAYLGSTNTFVKEGAVSSNRNHYTFWYCVV